MNCRQKILSAVLLAGVCQCAGAEEDAESVDALLRTNAYVLEMKDGALSGPGAGFLSEVVSGTQFVALGEAHNNRQIPELTTALFRLLNRQEGFEFLILEQDPVMMTKVSRPPVKGDLEDINALARRYLKGFVFISDQELQMLADVGAVADSAANVIWGCEQAFGVTHILDELRGLAPGEAASEYVEARREESAVAEAERDLQKSHYIYDAELQPLADKLERLFGAADDSREKFLINAIRKSDEIYGYYEAGNRDELPGYYSNNAVREEYMKTRCLDEYRLAERRDGMMPKGLMKFGHWHLYKGLSPANILTLGHFMYDFARANDKGFFSISIIPFNEQNDYGGFAAHEKSAFLKPFKSVASDEKWTILDLRPFREYPRRRALIEAGGLEGEAIDELTRIIYGFDALLLMGGATPATFDVTGVSY